MSTFVNNASFLLCLFFHLLLPLQLLLPSPSMSLTPLLLSLLTPLLQRHERGDQSEQPREEAPVSSSAGKRIELTDPISVNAMRDGVVNEAVCKRHVRDIIHFIAWLHKNKEDWMTAHGLKLHRETNVLETEGERNRA